MLIRSEDNNIEIDGSLIRTHAQIPIMICEVVRTLQLTGRLKFEPKKGHHYIGGMLKHEGMISDYEILIEYDDDPVVHGGDIFAYSVRYILIGDFGNGIFPRCEGHLEFVYVPGRMMNEGILTKSVLDIYSDSHNLISFKNRD